MTPQWSIFTPTSTHRPLSNACPQSPFLLLLLLSAKRSPIPVLKARSHVPYIRTFAPDPTARLIILPGEDDPAMPSTARGRPIGPEYYDVAAKIAFMDAHGIHISVLSQANPWLDFLAADEAPAAARTVNGDINAMCACYPGRLFAFATLPVAAGPAACVDEVRRLRDGALPWVRGVVLGTNALGRGLDDAEMDAVWAALQDAGLTVFVHPHYGLPKDVYGPRAHEYGHVLPLAMGSVHHSSARSLALRL